MSATLSLPQSVAVDLQTGLDADFKRGIGWCFNERFIRHHIINTLARQTWPTPAGYQPGSLRIATDYTLPWARPAGRGRPHNLNIAVLHSNHSKRAKVRNAIAPRSEQWALGAEVIWIETENDFPVGVSVNESLNRLNRLEEEHRAQVMIILAGSQQAITKWTAGPARYYDMKRVGSSTGSSFSSVVYAPSPGPNEDAHSP